MRCAHEAEAEQPHPTHLHKLETMDSATQPMKVVIAGGRGALGSRLAADLTARGHEVVVLTRSPQPQARCREVAWDGRTVGAWAAELQDDIKPVAVVNLAGELVDRRPTQKNIDLLRASRVEPTRALVNAAARLERPVRQWVQGSTTAIWSDAGEQQVSEATPVPDPGLPQMTGVAAPWEAAVEGVRAEHVHVLRTSFVLDTDTPVMDRLLLLARLGLGGPLGTGEQWVSWIHIDDWLAVVRALLGLTPGTTVPDGVVIAAAPTPVRNRDLMRQLRRTVGRSFGLPAPAPLVRLGALALRSDAAVGLTGRRCTSRVLADVSWSYEHPELGAALDHLTRPERRTA
jgi:uncharacterized protein